MYKAYKYRIYPTTDQKVKIDQSIGVCRLVYNLALEGKIRTYKEYGISLSAFDMCKQLVELKAAYPWIAEVDSQALQAAVKKVDVAFRNFFHGGGYPKFKSKKKGVQSFQCPNNTRKIDFEGCVLTVPKIANIPIAISRRFEGNIKTVTISKTPTGKYYASVLVEENIQLPEKPSINPDTTIGIDLGIKSLAVTSDGRFFASNRYLKNNLQRLKVLQRRASRKQKGSNNRKKANLCVSILHEKITNQRTDYIHKVTTGLIRDNQAETFVMEDLNVAGMLKNRKLSQAISDVGFGEFVRQMKYKCDWHGKNFIQIGRFEPSSKTCSECKTVNEILTLGDREWVCASCGTLHDRDLNAARNIRQMGLNKQTGEGIPGEPVELRTLVRAWKQEVLP